MPAVAVTDHGNLYGAVEFYSAARKAEVKPILGCEFYLATGDRRLREPGPRKEYFHLVLLAENLTGYHNLMHLASIGFLEGFYRKPRIDKEVLRQYSQGLLGTCACLAGEIPQALLAGDFTEARQHAQTYLDIFGPDRFFIEVQDHGIEEQQRINPGLFDLANELGVAVIATNDAHYLHRSDAHAHDVLCCINTGAQLEDEGRFRFPSDEFYVKTGAEMAELFPGHPEVISNTLHVAEMCNVELDLSSRHAPVYRVPDSVTNEQGEHLDDATYLRQLVEDGARQRYGEITDELQERIDYELGVITSKGFASYFLIVWDCVNYCRQQGIPVGARGSGCSSVVAYCLYISAPDPIRYGLYFERFMDPDRDEMPDIDLDICQNGRAQVIEYVRQKYGHVAQIITFGTLKPRAAIKDVSRVMGLGFDDANKLTQLVPTDLKITIDKALEREPELRKQYESDARVKQIIDVARTLEGVARNAGVHAAGVVVADQPLTNFLPVCRASDGEAVVTQFDGPTVERVGLLKMDFLGLRTLTTLEHARQLAQARIGRDIDLGRLDLTDPRVYELFVRGDTKGIFQFESGGMRDVLMRMRPNRIEDLIAANALYRPGPMEYIPEYVARKHGQAWTTPHPVMTEVLNETYGIMVYQEQVSRMVNRLGGIELKQAFRLAKAISKKKTHMIEAMREPFIEGCAANNLSREKAQTVFEDILKFGGYAFNKAHSTGYALVAFQTAWMKAYFPVEFMAAVITFEMGSTDKVAEYRDECKELGITVEPPDVNASQFAFAVETKPGADAGGDPRKSSVIRYGLGALKGMGGKAVAAIVAEREKGGPYRNIFDFCARIDLTAVNRAALEALVCAGAFDKTGAMRKAMVDSLDRALTHGQQQQQDRRAGQFNLFGGGGGDDEADEPVLSREEWDESEMLRREKEVLGLYITKHPLANHERLLQACSTAPVSELARLPRGTPTVLGGMVTHYRSVTARAGRNPGQTLGILTFEDLTGKLEVVLYPDELARYRSIAVPDAILFLQGKTDVRRDEPSFRLERIITLAEAPEQLAAHLVVDIARADQLEPLTALLRAHRGPTRVYLNVHTADGLTVLIEASVGFSVACSPALLAGLRELLGPRSARLLGRTRRVIPTSSANPTEADTPPLARAASA